MIEPIYGFTIPLFSAHIIVDFLIYPDEAIKRKGLFLSLLKHSILIAIFSYILLGKVNAWAMVLVITLLHATIDFMKVRLSQHLFKAFLFDQGIHVAVIILLTYFVNSNYYFTESSIWYSYFGTRSYALLVFIMGVFLCTHVGGIIVGIAVQPLLAQLEQKGDDLQRKSPDLSEVHARGLRDAGKIIGYLERSLIYLFVLVDQPSAIGFLIAAKSIFRFGEIRERSNRMEAEYIIIGTLLSFLYGLIVSYSVQAILLSLS